MAKKTNMKSVRLSDQVMDYVINFEGEGFNQKFENLVLFCMEQEESKKQRITLLDQQIARQYGGQMTCLDFWMNCWKIKTLIRNCLSPDSAQ